MLEEKIIGYLNDVAPAYAEFPDEPPADGRFFVIERVGGGAGNTLSSGSLAIQSYGASLLAAAALNHELKAAMESFRADDGICSLRLNSDYNYTDTRTKRYRYQAVYDIVHY